MVRSEMMERMSATEKFDQSWYPGEALVSQSLAEKAGRTTITITLRYESREARDMVLESGATGGIELSYDRLAGILAAA